MKNLNLAKKTLQEYYGFNSFKEIQKKPLLNILNKHNTLAVLPTGEGKSILYQIPGIMFNGLTIVISPLISLMKDQVVSLKKKNIKADFFNSTLSNEEKNNIFNKIENNEIKLLYVSPERLFIDNFLDKILDITEISLIAIDEIHCVSQWGNDFRKEYLNMSNLLLEKYKSIPIIGTTATADLTTLKSIKEIFKFEDKNTFINSPIKDNIEYLVEKKVSDGFEQILSIIKKEKGKQGIVYCFTKKEVSKLSGFLRQNNIKAQSYHADLKQTSKDKNYTSFINGSTQIIVATIAFGMGIDKPDIRFVIHNQPSLSLENFIQETGRIGRDGKLAKSYLLLSKKDLSILNWVLKQNNDNLNLNKYFHMNMFSETPLCKKTIFKKYFLDDIDDNKCNKCSSCYNTNSNDYFKDEVFLNLIYSKLENNFLNFKTFCKNISNDIKKYKLNEIEHYVYQMYIHNIINIDIQNDNLIVLNKKIDDFKFLTLKLLETNFILPIKKIKKKVAKKSTTTSTKKTTPKRSTTSTKKTVKPSTKKSTTTSTKKNTTKKRTPSTNKKTN